MPITGGTTKGDKIVYNNIDANTLWTSTDSLSLEDATHIGLFVNAVSGAHLNHIIEYEIFDGEQWHSTGHGQTGIGFFHRDLCVAEDIRVSITTVEGSPSLVNIIIIIK